MISIRSKSDNLFLVLSNNFFNAYGGASKIIPGLLATCVYPVMIATGPLGDSSDFSSEIIIADAPSLIWEAFPGVTDSPSVKA